MRPRELFMFFAKAEVVTWTLLILGMVLKYVTHTTEVGVRIFGLLHGVVFLSYVLLTLAIWTNHRWRASILLRALVAGVIPFATLWFERWARRRRELSGDWRLGRNGSYAYTNSERILAWVLRHPKLGVFLAAVAVLAVTSGLLWLGNPKALLARLT